MRNRAGSHCNQLYFVMENIYQAFFFSFVGSSNSAIITSLMYVIQFLSYTSQLFKSAVFFCLFFFAGGYQLDIISYMNILSECFIHQSNGHSFAKLMSLQCLEAS